jgi:hypothetical protein
MGVPPTTQFDPVQVAAANGDALQAAAKGATSMASVLNDADGYGSLPSPPIGDFETMSPAEMMSTEAQRRFADSEWNKSITQVSSRALWVDYLRAMGVSAQLNAAIRQKKERMEALMAVYTSQKLAGSVPRSMPLRCALCAMTPPAQSSNRRQTWKLSTQPPSPAWASSWATCWPSPWPPWASPSATWPSSASVAWIPTCWPRRKPS